MTAAEAVVERVGRVGVWSWVPVGAPAGAVRELAQAAEELGYGSLWYPEAIGKESLSTGALLLSWTKRLGVGTSIMNIWARDPVAAASGAKTLEDAYPGRFVLGLGVSHSHVAQARGHEYGKPLATMRAYLDAMDSAPYQGPEPATPAPRVIAALAPKMLQLAAERSAGSIPYLVPPEHTSYARERLGADAFLGVEQAVVLTGDAAAGREQAREFVAFYLRAENYVNNLKRIGWADDDIREDNDKLVDALVAVGDESAIKERAKAHFDAGADHVCIQVIGPRDGDGDAQQALLDALQRLAKPLLEL
jgi:probable F420-dependent oxidoreductase